MTNYNTVIALSNVTQLSPADAVETAASWTKHIGQTGISYQPNGDNVLTSNSALDVIQTLALGYWTHSKTPAQLSVGDTVYITTNASQTDLYGGPITVVATVAEQPFKVDPTTQTHWASSNDVA